MQMAVPRVPLRRSWPLYLKIVLQVQQRTYLFICVSSASSTCATSTTWRCPAATTCLVCKSCTCQYLIDTYLVCGPIPLCFPLLLTALLRRCFLDDVHGKRKVGRAPRLPIPRFRRWPKQGARFAKQRSSTLCERSACVGVGRWRRWISPTWWMHVSCLATGAAPPRSKDILDCCSCRTRFVLRSKPHLHAWHSRTCQVVRGART
mmetsp:Transcript_8800/g.54045  ORF Transcript_8800/g.54045 Transcript_8800/m.54045 type:complete len:205 (-) Transcript_8800:1969-2583(-)